MTYLGDIGAIEAGGRIGNDLHVRSKGVINELKFLWRQLLFSHSRVSAGEAWKEAVRLIWRFSRLLLNETGVWTDSTLDQEAERVFLATSSVPVAIVGMKSDLLDRHDAPRYNNLRTVRTVPEILLHSNNAAHDSHLHAFLRRVSDSVRRKTPAVQSNSQFAMKTSPQIMFGF